VWCEGQVRSIPEINKLLSAAEEELGRLNAKRSAIQERIDALKRERAHLDKVSHGFTVDTNARTITNQSSESEKIALFRRLFKGREDVYARRYESMRTGKTGYYPASSNPWAMGGRKKPDTATADLDDRDFLPLTDDVIRNHLLGKDPQSYSKREFTVGIYPLLPDETCWFLAIDFDKATWMDDVSAYLETCVNLHVPASLERSRSGNGGHIWIFFSEPIAASLGRQLGSFILTETMRRRPEIGFDSYDRFFPNQDTMPRGGFGNLIALPLQKGPRECGNTVFLDDKFAPRPDQWAYLSSIQHMSRAEVEDVVQKADRRAGIYGATMVIEDAHHAEPWLAPPSRRRELPPLEGPFPEQIPLVLGNQIYIAKDDLTPSLQNRLIRLATFQNPEFYKAQAMRFSTYGKPRIISCCEDFPKHIGLPRGCLDEVIKLLRSLKIAPSITDERFSGEPIDFRFLGTLRPEQQTAADALLCHDTGVLSATTAFGKTVVATYMIAERGVNTLVLVHRSQLLDQWVAHIGNFLG